MDFIEIVKSKEIGLSICPVGWKYKEAEEILNFTDKDFEKFCKDGCSVECDKFYQEFLIKAYKKKVKRGEINVR